MIKDMTEGKPSRILWAFSIPMLISVMFQQIYNIADSMIAGKFVGEGALAAVGASYPITMIFMAIAMGCNIGCSVVISQLFGARKYGEMKTAITTTFFSCGALSILLTLLGLLFCHPMLEMIRTPDNIFSDAALYLNIYIGGLAFLFLYNICTGIFTALGDSRTPLYFLIGSSIGNIILDLVFVIFLKMGVAGVAWATFIAQGISCILSAVTLTSRVRSVRTQEKPALFSLAMLGKISWIAVPSILQQSFISVGNIFIQFLVNGFGSAAIAGYSAAVKLNTFSITSITTLANGLSSFTAQNIGAGKLERVRKGFRSSIVMLACVVLPFFIAYFFFDEHMLMLFMSGRRSLGDFHSTGNFMYPLCRYLDQQGQISQDTGEAGSVLTCHARQDKLDRSAEYPSAELYICGEYFYPVSCQWIRVGGYRRVLCSCEVEHLFHYFNYNSGKRAVQLYSTEYRGRKAGKGQEGIQVFHCHAGLCSASILYCLFLL